MSDDLHTNEPESASTPSSPSDPNELKREILDFVKLVVWFLIIFLSLKRFVLEGYEVQGESMEPNLFTDERILVLKLPHELSKIGMFSNIAAFKPGDIVVFSSPDTPNKRYVKRIIALGPAGDSSQTVAANSEDENTEDSVLVQFDHGKVYVNNRIIEENYLSEDNVTSGDSQKLTLQSDEVYVLGDNRKVSKDSRSFDAIDKSTMIGKAVIRFWPPNRISFIH
ncbi:MAG: hypothetical protein COA73_09530 [Candidatus Hydrogenedentota bacterium]|nr:MAG: hypothetical protein COA73_09530 [Candidatus Hydrogenedentota bacterium]